MKRTVVAACVFLTVSFGSWSQSFKLPEITNTISSVQIAFRSFAELTRDIGSPEYKREWSFSEEIFLKDITAYLDSIIENMNYASLRDYTRLIRTNIDRIDYQAASRNQMTEFDRELRHILPNNAGEVRDMQNEYKTKPFPFTLNNDENVIAEQIRQVQEYERQLSEHQNQLDALPTIAQLNNRLQEIRRELLTPNVARNTKLKNQLEDEESAINRQKPGVDEERKRLTRLISDLQTQIRRSNVDNFVANMESEERNRFIASVWTSFNDFHEWEKFFNNENTCLKDFFILSEAKQKLYKLLDNVPQGQVQAYRTRLDVFCVGWGI